MAQSKSAVRARRTDKKRELFEVIRENFSDPEAESNEEVNVGVALRKLRTERRLSLRALAEQSGLAVNTLSLIENGKTSPSVSTLQQLAAALRVPITAFFHDEGNKSKVAYLKVAERRRTTLTHGTLENLSGGLTNRPIEPFVLTIKPASASGTTPIVHNGYEFVFCLEGQIIYTIEDETYPLSPGDSLLFEAHLPHQWQNVKDVPARAMLIFCQSAEHSQPLATHLDNP